MRLPSYTRNERSSEELELLSLAGHRLERYSRRKWWGRRQCRRGRQKKASRSRDRRWNYINFGTSSRLAEVMRQLVSITVEESRSHF